MHTVVTHNKPYFPYISVLTKPPATFSKLVITVRVMIVTELFVIRLQLPRRGLRQRFLLRRAVRP